jgi:hypothetical protein
MAALTRRQPRSLKHPGNRRRARLAPAPRCTASVVAKPPLARSAVLRARASSAMSGIRSACRSKRASLYLAARGLVFLGMSGPRYVVNERRVRHGGSPVAIGSSASIHRFQGARALDCSRLEKPDPQCVLPGVQPSSHAVILTQAASTTIAAQPAGLAPRPGGAAPILVSRFGLSWTTHSFALCFGQGRG